MKPTLMDAIENAPSNHNIFKQVSEMISSTGLTKEQINEILKPYSDSILSDNGLSEKEIKEIANIIISKK